MLILFVSNKSINFVSFGHWRTTCPFSICQESKTKTNEMFPSKYERLNAVCVPGIRRTQSETGNFFVFLFISSKRFLFPSTIFDHLFEKSITYIKYTGSSRSLSKMQNNFPSLFFLKSSADDDRIQYQQYQQPAIFTEIKHMFLFYFRCMAWREKEVSE